MADTTDTVTVEPMLPAPPEKVSDLPAGPARHRDIDGSGTVRDAKSGSERLTLGSTFGMSMKMGMPHSLVRQVIDLEGEGHPLFEGKPGHRLRGEPADRVADQATGLVGRHARRRPDLALRARAG